MVRYALPALLAATCLATAASAQTYPVRVRVYGPPQVIDPDELRDYQRDQLERRQEMEREALRMRQRAERRAIDPDD